LLDFCYSGFAGDTFSQVQSHFSWAIVAPVSRAKRAQIDRRSSAGLVGHRTDKRTLEEYFDREEGGGSAMITDSFDRRTMANMEVALERACLLLPAGSEHNARRIVASKIIECANRGDASLSRLTEAGYTAAMQLTTSAQSVRNREAAN
jgi:hypothetical protein